MRILGADVAGELPSEPADVHARLLPVRVQPLLAGLPAGALVTVDSHDGVLDVSGAATTIERVYHQDVATVAARIAHANDAVVVDAATADDVAFAYGARGVRTLRIVGVDAPMPVLPAHGLALRVTRR